MKARTGYSSRLWFLVLSLLTAFIAGCGGSSSSSPSLSSVEVTTAGGASATFAKGTQLQLKATGIYSNSSTADISDKVTWSSGDTTVATVDANGKVTSLKKGAVVIKATLGAVSGSKSLLVSDATVTSLAITPLDTPLPKGATRQLTAMATFTDNTTQDVTSSASWSSAQPAVATVGNATGSKGKATAVASEGTTTITASYGGKSASGTLTVADVAPVSLQITPVAPSNALGTTRQFTATAIYSDGSNLDATPYVTWSSSDETVATISNDVGTQGLASTLKIGNTTIKASATVDGVTYEDSTTLTVTAVELVSVQVTPTNPDVAKGLKQQFTAMATYSDNSVVDVTQDSNTVWSSSDEAVATVSNATDTKGLVGTVNTGSSEIKAVFGGQTGSSTINVVPVTVSRIDITPTTPSVAKGRTLNLTATAVFNDNSTQNVTSTVTWSSSDRSVADIGNASGSKGLVVASKVGKTTITATLGAKSGTTELTVTPAELVTISVAPAAAKLAKGYQLQFQATGTFSDGSKADVTSVVTWTSNASSTASVSNAAGSQGLVKGLAAGSATITAVDPATFLQGSQSMQVTDATLTSIDVTAGNPASATPSLAKGKTLQFSALGHFSDATTLDLSQQVTWSSDDLTIATISNADDSNGLATALKEGAVAITATVADGTAGSATLTVTSAVLTKIEVAPASASLVKGLSQPYQATGTYSDNTTADITTQVTWSSDDAAIASVSNAAGSEGVVKGTGVGGTSISAVLDGVTGAADVTVTAAELTEVQVSTSNASVAVGDKPQFVATGLYTDGSTQDLTDSVVWSSSDLTVADVSNASGSEGLVTALKAGSTDITASFASKSGKATLTVTAAEVRSLEITPANPSMPKGTTLKLKATAVYSDGSRVVVTDTVTWSSADNAKATVSNDSGNKGLVAANGLGEVVISASNGTVTGSTKVTVTAAALTSISVAPASGDGSVPAGGYTLQYQATGTYSDGSTADITTQVTWSSLDENVAAASNTAGQKGLVTSAGAGGTLVVATLGSVTGSGAVTVTNATLQSISVTPTGRTLNNNATLQFAASGTFSDGTVLVLTKQVVWASSNTNLVTISNAKDSEGLATATGLVLLPTNVTISATRSGITGSTTVSRAP